MATRKDSRGYSLKKGESQRKDGRYVFRYTTLRGEHRSVYAKELSELRKKEVKIRRAIEDGLDPDRAERITLNELFDEYISQKYELKQSTMTNYKYMYNHYVRDGFGKLRISKIKYSDIKKFYYSLILEKGFKPNSMEIVHTLLHPTLTMAVRDGLLRLNPTEGVMAEIKKSHCWEKTKRHALTVAEQRAFTNYIANSEEYRGLTENNSGYRGFRQAPSKKGCDQNCTQLSWTLLELVGGFIEKRVYFVDVVGV